MVVTEHQPRLTEFGLFCWVNAWKYAINCPGRARDIGPSFAELGICRSIRLSYGADRPPYTPTLTPSKT